jgi:hypothetical protein
LRELHAVALGRVAVAAAASRLLVIDGAARDTRDEVFVARRDQSAVRISEPDEVERAAAAAKQAKRRLEVSDPENNHK